jgi:hypothetical protein
MVISQYVGWTTPRNIYECMKIDTKKLIDYLSAKWQNRACPMCGARQWSVQEKSYELREFHGGSLVVGGSAIIPVIPVICGNCGNTILVNSILAGIDKRKEGKNE